MRPLADREQAWQRLAEVLDVSLLDNIVQEITLAEAIPTAEKLLAGQIRGRVVVDINR